MTQRVQRDRQDHVAREPGPTDGACQQLAENPRDRELAAVLERLHESVHRRGVAECRMTARIRRRTHRASFAWRRARTFDVLARRTTRTGGWRRGQVLVAVDT